MRSSALAECRVALGLRGWTVALGPGHGECQPRWAGWWEWPNMVASVAQEAQRVTPPIGAAPGLAKPFTGVAGIPERDGQQASGQAGERPRSRRWGRVDLPGSERGMAM
jgi:hypothetical protein